MPKGYQRHDSFPVQTQGLGTVVEHSFDFGDSGRTFGFFDRGSDGGDAAVIADTFPPASPPAAVSFAATEDAGGFALWTGECRGDVSAAALARSWLILEFDPKRVEPMRGETVARLNSVQARSAAIEPNARHVSIPP